MFLPEIPFTHTATISDIYKGFAARWAYHVPSCISYTIPLVCNYLNRLPCGMWTVVVVVSLLWLLVKFFVLYVIFYYIFLFYARGGIVRTFKGSMHVRSKVVRTYVQGCYGRTCRECLVVRPRELWKKVNEWVKMSEWNMGKMNDWWTGMNMLSSDWHYLSKKYVDINGKVPKDKW